MGSSSASLARPMAIFSWPALVLGSIARSITGSGNSMDSRMMGYLGSQRVSPVVVFFQANCGINIPCVANLNILPVVLHASAEYGPFSQGFCLVELYTLPPALMVPE